MSARVLLTLIALLLGGAAAALVADRLAWPARATRAREFQGLVGGLGFGPAAELSRCPFSFDPRLGPACPQDLGPVAGGAVFCPHHGFSLFHYPPLRNADAPPP